MYVRLAKNGALLPLGSFTEIYFNPQVSYTGGLLSFAEKTDNLQYTCYYQNNIVYVFKHHIPHLLSENKESKSTAYTSLTDSL
jgi:hypothetical protein